MAMIKPNKDIMEEMYAFLYEVTPVKTEHTLPIYQTYKTNEGQTHLKIVENQFAAFPSDMSQKKNGGHLWFDSNLHNYINRPHFGYS